MNSSQPSPFTAAAQARPARSRVKLAVFSVLALNAVFCLTILLTPGCKRETHPEPPPEPPAITDTTMDPLMDTNVVMADPWEPAVPNVAVPPVPPPVAPPVAPPILPPIVPAVTALTTYQIQAGDTFDAIARRTGATVAAIQAANPGVDPRRLRIGSTINLPAPNAAAPAAPTGAAGENIYVVKSGDTLSRIAAQHGTTVRAIRQLNGLVTDRIRVGQRLKLPAQAPAPEAPAPFDPFAPPPPGAFPPAN